MDRYSSFFVLHMLGWGAFGILWFFASIPIYEGLDTSLGVAAVRVFIYVLMGASITLLFRPLYQRLWRRGASLLVMMLIATAISLMGSVTWAFAFEYFKWPLTQAPFDAKPFWEYARSLVATAFLLLTWSLLYFGIKYRQKLQYETERALKAEALAHRARVEMLRYQLNPHFLFNALNSIRVLVDEDRQKAKGTITGLSDYLRFALLDAGAEITVHEEIDIVKRYLEIEKIRFEERLRIEMHVAPEVNEIVIPAFLIHPLVENAVKHGMQSGIDPLQIEIEVTAVQRALSIRVANSGTWEPTASQDEERKPVGLKNVQDRLEQIFSGRHTLSIDTANGWVRIEIVLDGLVQKQPAT